MGETLQTPVKVCASRLAPDTQKSLNLIGSLSARVIALESCKKTEEVTCFLFDVLEDQ